MRLTVPDDLLEAQEQFAQVRREKEAAINAEDFDQAAALRDKEQQPAADAGGAGAGMEGRVDLAAVVQENQRLHREVEHLLELLRRHGIEPNGGTAGDRLNQPGAPVGRIGRSRPWFGGRRPASRPALRAAASGGRPRAGRPHAIIGP